MKKLRSGYVLLAFVLIGLLVTSCKKSARVINPPPVTTGVQITNNAKLGAILTDNNGRSLYFFSMDMNGNSNCVNGCAITWPPFFKDNPSLGTGLTATDFAVITRPDGAQQNTYKGWPLYYYVGDIHPGDTNGDAFASLWAIGRADYTVMFANAQLVGLDGLQYTDQGVAGTGVSQFITDANGNTLYMLTKDGPSQNKFTKPDFSNNSVWPIDSVTAIANIPTVLDKTQFTTIDVFGHTQLVFKGHPLYHFGQDNSTRGSTKGVSFPFPGQAIWKVVNNNTPAQ